jgi:hypothetical protein
MAILFRYNRDMAHLLTSTGTTTTTRTIRWRRRAR